jgi:hypothetical protein
MVAVTQHGQPFGVTCMQSRPANTNNSLGETGHSKPRMEGTPRKTKIYKRVFTQETNFSSFRMNFSFF